MGNPLTRPAAQDGKSAGQGGRVGSRAVRFELLRQAQRLLNRPDASMADQHETVWCHRSSREEYTDDIRVTVYRAADGSDASVHGLITCGNVWACPVCSARVAEERRKELHLAMVKHLKAGGHAYLMSLTFTHGPDDSLGDLLAKQAKALAWFKAGKGYRTTFERYGRIGSAKGLELTHGQNGWHPHTHDLIFAAPGLLEDRAALRKLKAAWLWACVRAGLVPGVRMTGKGRSRRLLLDVPADGASRLQTLRNHWKHGLDLRGGSRAAEYVAKFGHDEAWGITSEIAKGYAKIGVKKSHWTEQTHCTPFQLLVFALHGDRQAGALYREYAAAMKGKRQLVWSRGLKGHFGIADATDEELSAGADPMPERQEVGELTGEEWSVILSRSAIGDFLRYVADCCGDLGTSQNDIREFVAHLRRLPQTGRGTLARRSRMDGLRAVFND
jgi:hypothetical protein